MLAAAAGFALFETLYATRERGVRHLDQHLARLAAAARHFSFAYDDRALRAALDTVRAGLPPQQPHRLRVTLAQDGTIELTHALMTELAALPVTVLLATQAGFAAVDADNPLLRYKTTLRQDYDRAWQAAEARGAFDMLFVNRAGELTEGARSSVFVRVDGCWVTPPLSCGVLPGVMRGRLLADPAWQAQQRVITLDELLQAEALVVCNALRGPLAARLLQD